MKKSIFSVLIFILTLAFNASISRAQNAVQFNTDLEYGMVNNFSVTTLQQFLKDHGYFNDDATGNYFDVTSAAVRAFQKDNNISQTGTFGPLSRAAANRLIVSESGRANIAITSHTSGSVEVGNMQTIQWATSNYSEPTVRINVIKKVSDNPARYELVRTVAAAKSNNGSAVWVPAKSDIGQNVSIEVACTPSAHACRSGNTLEAGIAVTDSSRYANTAAAFHSIESAQNK